MIVHDSRNRFVCTSGKLFVLQNINVFQPSEHKDIICHMAKMVEKIMVPMARASILWLIGEYSERVPKIAPDVLRKFAKSFIQEVGHMLSVNLHETNDIMIFSCCHQLFIVYLSIFLPDLKKT